MMGDSRELEALRRALEASERRFQDLVETSHHLVWSVDAAGCWTYLNRQPALRIYGREPEEMLGRPFAEVVAPERLERDLVAFEEIKEGRDLYDHETVHLHADGRRIPLRFNAIMLRDETGEVRGTTGTARETWAELRLREASKAEALGRLAGGVAHDFNNLLAGIVGYADLLRRGLAEGGAKGDLELLAEGVLRAARTAGELTRQLVTLSRRSPPTREPVDLHDLVREVRDLLGHLIDRRIELRLELEAPAATTLGDRAQLQTALLNLALNGRDAMPEGGQLVFASSLVERDAAEGAPARFVRLEVRDTGGGIAPEHLDRVFDPFFTTKDLERGTGLGLAVVEGTVRNHGGLVEVESVPGEGARFALLLPFAEAQVVSPRGRARPAGRGAGERVLVADDDEIARVVTRTMLEALGYRVEEACDGEEAVEVFQARAAELDLVLLDLVMPRRSGHEVLAVCRAVAPAVPVLVCSGFAEGVDPGGLRREGAVGFLAKPFDLEQLGAAVRMALGEGGEGGSS